MPTLICPTCGKPVILIFWEWPANAPVSAEYHHVTDAERDRDGLPPEPHTSFYSYEEARRIRFADIPGVR